MGPRMEALELLLYVFLAIVGIVSVITLLVVTAFIVYLIAATLFWLTVEFLSRLFRRG